MKLRYLFGASLLSIALMTSCDDFLSTTPDNRMQVDTEEKIKELLVSAYPTSHYAMLTELESDNTDENIGSYQSGSIFQTEAATWQDATERDADAPYSLWDSCYRAISTANEALQEIEKLLAAGGLTDDEITALNNDKAEALLCRAYGHFLLTNVFCKAYNTKTSTSDLGVPYLTEPETTVSPQYQRGSVAEDYQKIQKDLDEGLSLMSSNYSFTKKQFHFNRDAAYAFAARFYLYYMQDDKSNLDKVIEYATKVLQDGVLCDWKTIGALSPNNQLRDKAFTNTDNQANLILFSCYSTWDRYYGATSLGTRYTHNNKICAYETAKADGPWGTLYFDVPQYEGIPKEIMGKLGEYFEYTDPVNGIGYVHMLYPEFTTDKTLIDRAEAYALKGEFDESLADMNTFTHNFTANAPTITDALLNRYYGDAEGAYAYYTPTEPTPKKELHPDFTIPAGGEKYIHAVLNMRRILALHEGLRWFDVKRYGMTIYRRGVVNGSGSVTVKDTMTKDDPRQAIQLPKEVITAGLEANPRNK